MLGSGSSGKRPASMLGAIMGQQRKTTEALVQGAAVRERLGPPSALEAAIAQTHKKHRALGGPVGRAGREPTKQIECCAHCGNRDPAKFQVDYNRGDRICMSCGAVDHNRLLSYDEEARTFADDTAADKDSKKRAEMRRDGGLGTFIASGPQRPGALPDTVARSLQRAQLRLQAPDNDQLRAADAPGAPGARARSVRPSDRAMEGIRAKIADIAAKKGLPEGLVEEAKRVHEEFLRKAALHAGACKDDKCHLHKRPAVQADVTAVALLVHASKRSGEGAEGNVSMMVLKDQLENPAAGAGKVVRLDKLVGSLLAWSKAAGCSSIVAGPAPGSGPTATKVGLAARFVSALCGEARAGIALRNQASEIIHWLGNRSLMQSRQPRTVAAAAVYVAYDELLRAATPGVDALEEVTLERLAKEGGFDSVGTVSKAVREIQGERAKAAPSAAAAAAGAQAAGAPAAAAGSAPPAAP